LNYNMPKIDDGSLAIYGGKPVRNSYLPYGHQSIDEEDIQAVVDVLKSDWITTGPKVDEFENRFAEYVNAKYAVSFSSGTASLHGAAFAAEIGEDDEVITTPLTFCATANCILYRNAKPVFADVSSDTLNLNPEEVTKKLSSKTKAIITVDYGGHPAEYEQILDIANNKGLVVIEDGCHALGAKYNERRVGSFSDMTVFSFHPVKHIATGEGGMVTTNNKEFARRLRLFRNHGITTHPKERQINGQWYYEMVELGYNYRLSDINCALGLSQLNKIEENIRRRREIVKQYQKTLSRIVGISLPVERINAHSAWHLYPIRLDIDYFKEGRDAVFSALRAENIGVNVHYVLPSQPYHAFQNRGRSYIPHLH